MRIVYLARMGTGGVRWVASDRTDHVVGDIAHQRHQVWKAWCDRHGWPDALVVVPGVWPTLSRALESACSEALLSISVAVDLAEHAPGRLEWGCRFWESETGVRFGEEGKVG